MVPDPPAKTLGMCSECKKAKLVLIRIDDIPGLPKDYVYKCEKCGYQVVETQGM